MACHVAAIRPELQPGQDALLLPVAGSEIVKNTTPGGRNYSGDPGDGASLVALYKSPTAICPVPPNGPGDATIDLNQDVYCIVDLVAFQQTTATLKIVARHSVTLARDAVDLPGLGLHLRWLRRSADAS